MQRLSRLRQLAALNGKLAGANGLR